VERLRLKVQIAMAVLMNVGLFQLHFICMPVLNCHSCPVSLFGCPLGVIGQFSAVGLIPLTVIGVMALVGLVAGRILCGWVCPFGLVQELLYKIPYAKFSIPRWTRFIKYGVFGALVVAVPYFLTPESTLYFCRLCPVATIESSIPWAILQGTTNALHLSVRIVILIVIMILAMGHRRFFCKVLCPIGACMSLLNRFAAIFPERRSLCVDCSTCNKVCPMETVPNKNRFGVYDDMLEECINCLDCQKRCPTDAIRLWG